MTYRSRPIILGAILATWLIGRWLHNWARAEDWPTYRHDNRGSGVTTEALVFPLEKAWEYQSSQVPRPAWPGPAKWDAYANLSNLKSMRNFDPVFHLSAVKDRIFFGSSADDAVHCLDATTGIEQWIFFCNGPVRLPPTCARDQLYFGSDDGCIYCIHAANGERIWDHCAVPGAAKIPVNGKLISLYPCRTGVILQDAKVYFALSLLPWEKTYVCAVDARSGASDGSGLYRKEYEHMTAQGPMLASATKLYVSQGRQIPLVFDRTSGDLVASLGSSGFGGVFGLLTQDSMFVHGHGQNHRTVGELRFFDSQDETFRCSQDEKDRLVTFPRATSIVIHNGIVYLHADAQLQAFHRGAYLDFQRHTNRLQHHKEQLLERKEKFDAKANERDREKLKHEINRINVEIARIEQQIPSCFIWRVPSDCPFELIMAGNTLIAGGEGKVAAYEITTGREVWRGLVAGRAYGLAVSQCRLFVSTDLGRVICFSGQHLLNSARLECGIHSCNQQKLSRSEALQYFDPSRQYRMISAPRPLDQFQCLLPILKRRPLLISRL